LVLPLSKASFLNGFPRPSPSVSTGYAGRVFFLVGFFFSTWSWAVSLGLPLPSFRHRLFFWPDCVPPLNVTSFLTPLLSRLFYSPLSFHRQLHAWLPSSTFPNPPFCFRWAFFPQAKAAGHLQTQVQWQLPAPKIPFACPGELDNSRKSLFCGDGRFENGCQLGVFDASNLPVRSPLPYVFPRSALFFCLAALVLVS